MISFERPSNKFQRWFVEPAAILGLMIAAPAAMSAEPAQKPLLSATTGAKPNLMIALDNSGSMAYPFHETYGINSAEQYELKYCPSPYSQSSSTNATTFNNGVGDEANYSEGTYTCYQRYRSSGEWRTRSLTNVAASYSPVKWGAAKWAAQRSADVNPIYYNPRITYKPRVDASNVPLTPNDGIVFVSNQNSDIFSSRSYRKDDDFSIVRLASTFYESNPSTTGWSQYVWTGNSGKSVPQHATYTATDANTPAFTYAYCDEVVSSGGLQVDCAQPRTVDIKPSTPASITLPSDHSRTDMGCTGNTCTNAAEVANILNWFRYYGFRAPAVATAIGQALAKSDYDNKLRLGYVNINQRAVTSGSVVSAIAQTPGIVTDNTGFLRGVRIHKLGGADTKALYTWLYDQDGSRNRTSNSGADATFSTDAARRFIPNGGTPLHNVLDKVADYYRVEAGATENPWATDPSKVANSSTNPEMSCRRSFTLLFSDGAWNAGTSTSSTDYDNIVGTSTFSRTLSDGSTETFSYNPQGLNTPAGRKQYTPYPSAATAGLADLTAAYYWHEDLRDGLDNGILTDTGQPAFWQNMTTYTVGYMVKPRGAVLGATSGLTFKQIEDYQSQYATSGYAASTKPTWATGNVNATTSSDQARVDDFIQAGFTGGGKGFSAQSAEDVREIFDIVLSDILNASGRDAGVAISTDASTGATIAGRLKYGVSYKTIDNSGDIVAQELDEDGNPVLDTSGLPETKWSAGELLPSHDKRRVFTLSDDDGPTDFLGRFDALPTDVRASLKYGPDAARVADDASFINYLRGLDPVTDAAGVLFRQRPSKKLGAMVNPPSIYMGGARDFAYDLGASTVDGEDTYLDYANQKRAWPATLMVATNAGMVHNLDAEEGDELAAFMPRRSLKRMLNYANDAYSFEYTLDGPLSEHDIYDDKNTWNHLAVGTGGRGEKLIYALRSPLNGTESTADRIPEKEDFLWEVGPTSGPKTVGSTVETDTINSDTFALGHITQSARSGQTENGEWVVVANSGHYNGLDDGSRHGLLLLDAMTGNVVKKIPLPATYSAGRGLSGVTLVRGYNKRIVAAYAGDENGNLWRFDLRGDPSEWKVSYDKPMFTTPNHRPIYGAPAWQGHPKGGNIVVVATGILLEEDDVSDITVNEAIYGIWDPTVVGSADVSPFTPVEVGDLLVQGLSTTSSVVVGERTFSKTTKGAIDWEKHRGWTFALGHTHTGERNIDQLRNVGNSVFINTTVVAPTSDADAEMCTAAGLPLNYIYGLRAIDGASQYSFDTDGDGKKDDVSMVLIGSGGYSRGLVFARLSKTTTLTEAFRENQGHDRDSGEAPVDPAKCTNEDIEIVGLNDATGAGVYCPVSGWSRSQYQLSAPPKN